MIKNKCFVCGSFNLRADRGLAGRLVCASCGNPYGLRKSGRNKLNDFNSFSLKKNHFIFFGILIIAFLIVII